MSALAPENFDAVGRHVLPSKSLGCTTSTEESFEPCVAVGSAIRTKVERLIRSYIVNVKASIEVSAIRLEVDIAREIQAVLNEVATVKGGHSRDQHGHAEADDPLRMSTSASHSTVSTHPHVDAPEPNSCGNWCSKPEECLPAAKGSRSTAIKEYIRDAVSTEYDVTKQYHTAGYCQQIAKSTLFETITLFVIGVNSLWIAIDTNYNDKDFLLDAKPEFIFMENFFCTFFSFELAVRFGAFQNKSNCVRDFWFCFDFSLVVVMVIETWITTLVFTLIFGSSKTSTSVDAQILKILRLSRLTRVGRLARILHAIPELIVLFRGVASASRSVLSAMVLLVLLMYVSAVIFTQVIDHLTEPDAVPNLRELYFSSVQHSMASLFLAGVLPDVSPFLRNCGDQHFILGTLAFAFVVVATVTLMNMLVGLLCDVVSVVSTHEREELTISKAKVELHNTFGANDLTLKESFITYQEFISILRQPQIAKVIQKMGVDVVGLVDYADYLFEDKATITKARFMDLLMELRGRNNCTVKDIVDLRGYMMRQNERLQAQLTLASSSIERVGEAIAKQIIQSSGSLFGVSPPAGMRCEDVHTASFDFISEGNGGENSDADDGNLQKATTIIEGDALDCLVLPDPYTDVPPSPSSSPVFGRSFQGTSSGIPPIYFERL
eukprot:TRINITY_DN26802_c0_g1_i1.p1 TRINITY_DN26802_c0_g1~~TRINITY_DN26802_c0_g1_i1.p1  ORF type:complete len:664 (-),score=69.89 TRINITY_DN26802_c0_g1_i1:83-2074(-)